jgi:hypothetical protein
MFPDYYQPAPVQAVDVFAQLAEIQPGQMMNRATFAEVLSSVDEFYQAIAGQTCTRSFPRLGGSGLMVRGAYWTLGISEYPNEDDGFLESSLIEILETFEDWSERHALMSYSDRVSYIQDYYLSPKACAGILRRAQVMGKEIKGQLKDALESVASQLREHGS